MRPLCNMKARARHSQPIQIDRTRVRPMAEIARCASWGASDYLTVLAAKEDRAHILMSASGSMESRQASIRTAWSQVQEAIDADDDVLRLLVLGAFDNHTSVLYRVRCRVTRKRRRDLSSAAALW